MASLAGRDNENHYHPMTGSLTLRRLRDAGEGGWCGPIAAFQRLAGAQAQEHYGTLKRRSDVGPWFVRLGPGSGASVFPPVTQARMPLSFLRRAGISRKGCRPAVSLPLPRWLPVGPSFPVISMGSAGKA